ncbi:hypothetical protein ACQP10_12995 [Streptosporangium sandarakinum]|uniref:hypothetical protein n=1 Tax=Streptosporangium sandarakinum TaxID=1260955 RepID=UPI003D8F683D
MFAARQVFFTPISGADIEATRRESILNAEDGRPASVLMALSGHRNPRTLGVHVQPGPARPGTEAVAAAPADQDPGRRRR